ncbi:helicase HerA domain-containing protein [Enterobacter sp. CPE_E1214]|uniref:helicase HerA domain-containing protein n=1 Tax=unclassified Enterobacter TaxID=2608935 RepID=UPI00388EB639
MATQFTVGFNDFQLRKGVKEPFIWNLGQLANGHVGITGTSGSGKTYQIRRFAEAFASDPQTRISIFDYHGDIEIPGASEVLFSESTRYGYNPFVVNPDPHYGGLRKSANHIIDIMSTNRKLGEQQAAVLRQLVMDCYALKRMYQEKPASWVKRNAPESECQDLYNKREWSALAQCYPTLTDLERLITKKLKSGLFGLDENNQSNLALRGFEGFMRAARALDKAKERNIREDTEKTQQALEKAKDNALKEYENALNQTRTGSEFDEILKYDSVDTLRSLSTRLENVKALGLFNANEPPFIGRIQRYNIKPLASSEDELKMFVYSRMMAIFHEEMQRGESHGKVRHVIILDEAKKFCDEESSNPINIIANEARKFGISLVLASQSPSHFSEDFINSAGTLLVQNMAPGDWQRAANKLQIEKSKLEYLKPRETALLKLQRVGERINWFQVNLKEAA